MWKSKEKSTKTNSRQEDTDRNNQLSNDGARKVALFLSVLDQETAEKLLTLLDPDVAVAVASEAKKIGAVSPEDVEKIISEYLEKVGDDAFGEELTDALVAQARSSVLKRDESEIQMESADSDVQLSSLDAVDLNRLAVLLAVERPVIVAAALTLLSSNRRAKLLALLPEDKRAVVSGITMKSGVSKALKQLEDVLFERALDYERQK